MEDSKKLIIFQCLFCGLLLIFVFQNPLQMKIPPLKYLDELYALLCIPLCGYRIICNNYRTFIPWKYVFLLILLGLFFITGIAGWVVNGYQPLNITLSDAFINMKFYLAIGMSVFLFQGINMERRLWAENFYYPSGALRWRIQRYRLALVRCKRKLDFWW